MAETTGYLWKHVSVCCVSREFSIRLSGRTYKFLNKNTADIARPTPTKA